MKQAAVWQGRVAVVRVLLARGARVNAIGLLGQTALHIAAYTYSFGTLDIARALIDAGADVNAPGEQGSSTPLHTAVSGTAESRVSVRKILMSGWRRRQCEYGTAAATVRRRPALSQSQREHAGVDCTSRRQSVTAAHSGATSVRRRVRLVILSIYS